jgi:hypothetical protein
VVNTNISPVPSVRRGRKPHTGKHPAEPRRRPVVARVVELQLPPAPPRTAPYTLDEVAALLNCDRSHVYHLVQAGQLVAENIAIPASPPKKTRACWRVWPQALEAFRAARRTKKN